MRVLIVILAAGASGRMRGRDKLLQDVEGVALLRHVVEVAQGCGQDCLVTLSPDTPARAALVADVPHVIVPDAASGMAASLRIGAEHAASYDGMMVLPADMPELRVQDLKAVIAGFAAAPERPARGCSEGGAPGHPVILPAALLPEVAALSGDQGARGLLGEDITLVPLPGQRACLDLDTPEDWAAWRKRRDQG